MQIGKVQDKMASWQFLQPWALALNRVLLKVHPEQPFDELPNPLVEIECFPNHFDYTAFGFDGTVTPVSGRLHVAIPADTASRGDRQHLQRVREAIELFHVLALVNSTAFEDLVFDFYDGVSGPNYVIHLEWRLLLIGSIAPDDPAATKATVTWGDLFGFPENPWDNSSDFCDAMRRVKDMARPTSGEGVDLLTNMFWVVTCDGISVRGRQDPPQDKTYTSALDVFSRRVGNCIEMDAPPVVQVGVVGDGSELVVAAWGQDAKMAHLDSTIIENAIYSAPVISQVTAALARCEINELTIGLGDAAADDQPNVLGIAGAGYLFSTVLCKNPPLYRPNQELVRFCSRRTSLHCVTVMYESGSTMRFGGIYSALAEALPAQEMVVDYDSDDEDDRYDLPPSQTHWEWLAYAFWSKTSNFSAQILRISYISLTDNDVAAVRRVLESNYPQPARQRDRTQAPKYGFVDFGAGTTERFRVGENSNDSVLLFSSGCRCRALYDPSKNDSQVDVVVPGYGICKIDLGASKSTFVCDSAANTSLLANGEAGIEVLELTLSRVESDQAIIDLLALVGGNITSLRINYRGRSEIAISLSALAASCPRVKVLVISDFDVYAIRSDEALLSWGIRELTICESTEVTGLTTLLSESACRMSRELEKLKIVSCRRPVSRDYLEALKTHDKEFLPVVGKKLPIECKSAMISVVRGSPEPARTTRMSYKECTRSHQALRSLDDNVLSLIFQFAATPKQRTVQISNY